MGDPTSYSRPRKFNFVTFLLILGGIALLYLGFQFGPPYYRKWKAKGVLSKSANSLYPKRHIRGTLEAEVLRKVQLDTINQLRNKVGIEDKGLTVRAHKDKITATVSADYREFINHPFVGKATVLHFRPWVQIDLVGGGLDDLE